MSKRAIQCAPHGASSSYTSKREVKANPPQTEAEAKDQARSFMKRRANSMRALAES